MFQYNYYIDKNSTRDHVDTKMYIIFQFNKNRFFFLQMIELTNPRVNLHFNGTEIIVVGIIIKKNNIKYEFIFEIEYNTTQLKLKLILQKLKIF